MNVIETVEVFGLRIGRTSLVVLIVGIVVIVGIGLMLRYTLLGKRMRALSDNLELAETSGIDTSRVILYTWLFAGALAGLAGVMAAATTELRPELGFELLLPIFAAVDPGRDRRRIRRPGRWPRPGAGHRVVHPVHRGALEGVDRLRGVDHRADRQAAGDLRAGERHLTAMDALPVAITFDFLTSINFWTSVGVLAATYALVALGLPAQRGLHRGRQLRRGRLHGGRRLHDGDPDDRHGDLVLARAPALDPGHDGGSA